MIDFKKRLVKSDTSKSLDPIEIYETLDRASDKGPLRVPQEAILKDWHDSHREDKELIVKLHTGQGKTLIGLLMLKSKLNEGKGPALYLCPNNFLINQTCLQAQQFGISVCVAKPEIPAEFIDGKSILVTSIQKLFNGLTKFGLKNNSREVGTLLMDDAHACVDSIRDSFAIKLKREDESYKRIRDLFASALESQGAGTFEEIKNSETTALLPVPYWAWRDKQKEVLRILANEVSKEKPPPSLKFTWPFLKDVMEECQCVVSGESLEIAPYLPPLEDIGSYFNAAHKIFISATVTNDSYLVKGLRLSPATIKKPLTYAKERWSGEKMILISELINSSLNRKFILNQFAPSTSEPYGRVVLTPSFAIAASWQKGGAQLVTTESIDSAVAGLKNKNFDKTLVIANRYDGIDLPDDMCRILVIDSKPHSDNLIERYGEEMRMSSDLAAMRTARTIEQGLGRSVRGEKDYCVIILCGSDLIENVRSKNSRRYLSLQTQTQLEIGIEIADMANEEIRRQNDPLATLSGLINQCLSRDDGWKQYYVEQMDKMVATTSVGDVLEIFENELLAEVDYQRGDWTKAKEKLQSILDKNKIAAKERGWYLQEMARYSFPHDEMISNSEQIEAHKFNRSLLKPLSGVEVTKILVNRDRISKIIDFLKAFEDYSEMQVHVRKFMERLAFGVDSDHFEAAFNEAGKALGFACERPDKDWKAGPDNLWVLRDNLYLLIECKSEVRMDRPKIYKDESGQMNNACAWFSKNYVGVKCLNMMIVPTRDLSEGAGFNQDVRIMRPKELGVFVDNIKKFFNSFHNADLQSPDKSYIQSQLQKNKLLEEDLFENYTVAVDSQK